MWFLGLSMRLDDSYETCGLVLLETNDNRFERTGLFTVGVEHLTQNPSYAQRQLMAHWGDDYEVRTVTIR
jgi:hypothetical protein